jgi:hypothetical protein
MKRQSPAYRTPSYPHRRLLSSGLLVLICCITPWLSAQGAEEPATAAKVRTASTALAQTPALRALPIQVDGQLNEPAWSNAVVLRDFVFPWSPRTAPATTLRALADADRLYIAFEVSDNDVVIARDFTGESTLDQEDRVEIFFARDNALNSYFCIEIDPLGRVHDYAARNYRTFDNGWNCPGLRAAGRIQPGGYTVEVAIPLRTLTELVGRPVSAGTGLRTGFFRAEFRHGSVGDEADNWISWVKPNTGKPDFHVPSALADWRIPQAPSMQEGHFLSRGVVLVPQDLPAADWPARAAQVGLTTLALHHGSSTAQVAGFIDSPEGHEFLEACARRGLHVEYELHAMSDLLPRGLFGQRPEWFRMNTQGERTPDANLCVHAEQALETVATNALRLARRLQPTTGRYFFWGDDGLPWCRCPKCREFSDSDQALILENHLLELLRKADPGAQLAHLAYANTLPPPTRVRPAPGVFLEFAPIHRRYDVPYSAQTGAEAQDALVMLRRNLQVFPVETAQVLEYWLDVSRFSQWKRPAVELPWHREVVAADVRTYMELGLRHVTTFGVWIDSDYLNRFGEPTPVSEYGSLLRNRQ